MITPLFNGLITSEEIRIYKMASIVGNGFLAAISSRALEVGSLLCLSLSEENTVRESRFAPLLRRDLLPFRDIMIMHW